MTPAEARALSVAEYLALLTYQDDDRKATERAIAKAKRR